MSRLHRRKKISYLDDKKRLVLVSFSGGLTSGYMSFLLKQHSKNPLFFIFANTGQEDNRTLDFINKCDREFELNLTWVEAKINPSGVGTSHYEVNYSTADREGKPFEDVIQKYGICNMKYPHCTNQLKTFPIHSYMREIYGKEYLTAIGIRFDEPRRYREKKNFVYPLFDWRITKKEVLSFWGKQSFTLGLREHEGNCTWCWKKSFKNHMRLIKETPSIYDFPRRMEYLYG